MFRSGLAKNLPSRPLNLLPLRHLHVSKASSAKALPPRLKIDEASLEENFLKGSGPGGQKINKTSSAVQLKHSPTGIVVKSQATRSRSQNRKYARQLLAEKLEEMEMGDQSRTAIKAAIKSKKKASASKKKRRKYRALEAEKETNKQAEVELDEKLDQATTIREENTSNVPLPRDSRDH